MEIEQSFSVPFPREQVWACFRDIEGIVGCLPGASLTEPPQDGKLKLAMTVKLGPIVAAFAGDGEMLLDDAAHAGSVSGSGADRKSGSRVKGWAAYSLHEEDGDVPTTRVDVVVDYTIAGSLAQFSRGGIVRDLATRLTAAFADNLKARLEAESVTSASAPVSTDGAATQRGSDTAARPSFPAAAPLDVGRLFWRVLLDRIAGFFRRLRGDTQ